GYSADEWTGDSTFFGRALHPDDRERVLATFAQAHDGLESVNCEYRIVRKDGSTVWVRDEAAIAYGDADEPLFIQGYMADITERKAIEEELDEAGERYRGLCEQLPLVTYIDGADVDGKAIYMSPQIEGLVGISAEEWVAHSGSFVSVLHPEDRDDVLAEARRCRQEGIPFEREYRLVTRTGEVIWIRDAAVPVGDPAAPRYWQGYVIDVTERKEVERWREQLLDGERVQNDRLLELDRMKDDFVASVSHELRTPLTSIRGYLDLVLDGDAGPLTSEQQKYLGVVARNSKRLLALVADLLVVAQSDSGALSLDRQTSDLSALASEAVFSAGPAAEDRGLDLTLDAEEVPALDLDRARFGQVLDNLISNALKFTSTGGSVEVRVRCADEHVVVEVADTGMGMSAPEQERLFERFYRTKSSSTQATPGTGLGLWISKTIVEAHGGEISVDSATGRGTTFRVELPLAA
ncbi:MAG: PAS domain-containing sensor histidine kinase, partial [Actinomycetota bacterium]|nr:PAS domain-containing sensor histidine kinase [Actinomycetota bacterium]